MGKTLREIFKDVHDMIQKQVDENDKKGFADLYKAAAEQFFDQHEKAGFHPANIEYRSGYYIFGFGTNSVVHYTLKECPGWLFGVWFSEPDKDHNWVSAEWFAQFEEIIDKFKPSASIIVKTIHFNGDRDGDADLDWYVKAQLDFIHNEPDLAFCRDYCSWDYNTKYHTREEAHDEFLKWRNSVAMEEIGKKEYLRKTVEVLVKHIPEKFADACAVMDRGECISPRYEFGFYTPNFDFEDEESPDRDSGIYDWKDVFTEIFGLSQEELDAMEQEFEAIDKWRRVYCDENDCCFWGEVEYRNWVVTTIPWKDESTLKSFISAE